MLAVGSVAKWFGDGAAATAERERLLAVAYAALRSYVIAVGIHHFDRIPSGVFDAKRTISCEP